MTHVKPCKKNLTMSLKTWFHGNALRTGNTRDILLLKRDRSRYIAHIEVDLRQQINMAH